MSGLLEQADRAFWTVRDGEACLAVLARRHFPVAEGLPETLLVVAEQSGARS